MLEIKGEGHGEVNALFPRKDTHRLTAIRPLCERRRHTFWRCGASRLTCL